MSFDHGAWIAAHDPLTVTTWTDDLLVRVGHPVQGLYVERFWLPILGPSALALLRLLDRALAAADGRPLRVPLGPLAASLGLGHGVGPAAPVVRTLNRLVGFGMAEPTPLSLRVRRHLGPLSQRQLARLPGHLREQAS